MFRDTMTAELFKIQPYKAGLKRGAIVKMFAALFQTAFLISAVSIAFSQSLGDLANKENERRKEVKNERVITDDEAAKYRTTPAAANAAKPESDPKASPPSGKEKPDSDEPTDFEGRGESYWRETMAAAHQKIKELENQRTELTLKINNLQNQFYSEDDGFKREGVQRDLQKTYYEQDKNKEELEKAKDALQDLQKEARRSGALPGWLTPAK